MTVKVADFQQQNFQSTVRESSCNVGCSHNAACMQGNTRQALDVLQTGMAHQKGSEHDRLQLAMAEVHAANSNWVGAVSASRRTYLDVHCASRMNPVCCTGCCCRTCIACGAAASQQQVSW